MTEGSGFAMVFLLCPGPLCGLRLPSEYPDTVGGLRAWPNPAILRPGECVGVAHRVRPCLVCDSRVARAHLPAPVPPLPDVPPPVTDADNGFPHGSLLLVGLTWPSLAATIDRK